MADVGRGNGGDRRVGGLGCPEGEAFHDQLYVHTALELVDMLNRQCDSRPTRATFFSKSFCVDVIHDEVLLNHELAP